MAQVPRFVAEFTPFQYQFIAGEDLRTFEGSTVTMAGESVDMTVSRTDAVTEAVIGVLVVGANTGSYCTVQCNGPMVTAIAGGTVTRGVAQMNDSTAGRTIDATGGSATLKAISGIACASATDGQQFPLLQCAPGSFNYYAS